MNFAERIKRLPRCLFTEIPLIVQEKRQIGADTICLSRGDPEAVSRVGFSLLLFQPTRRHRHKECTEALESVKDTPLFVKI